MRVARKKKVASHSYKRVKGKIVRTKKPIKKN